MPLALGSIVKIIKMQQEYCLWKMMMTQQRACFHHYEFVKTTKILLQNQRDRYDYSYVHLQLHTWEWEDVTVAVLLFQVFPS